MLGSVLQCIRGNQLNSVERSRNVAVVTAQFTDVWNSGNVDLIPEIYAKDFVGHFPGGEIHGHKGIQDVVSGHRL